MKSSRHVRRRLKSVRKLRNSWVITLDYIQTSKNLADPFTKGLSRNVIDNTSMEMGLRPTAWVVHSGLCDRRSSEVEVGYKLLVSWEESIPILIISLRVDAILSWSAWQVDIYLNVFQVAYLSKQRCCPVEHLLRNTPIWIWLLTLQSVRSECSLVNSWKALEYDVYATPAGKPCGNPVSVENLCETSLAENL